MIAKKIPIWSLMYLVNEEKIREINNYYKIVDNKFDNFKIVKVDSPPIFNKRSDINIEKIDEKIKEIENEFINLEKEIEVYKSNLYNFYSYFSKCLQYDNHIEINELGNKLEKRINRFTLFNRNFINEIKQQISFEKNNIQKFRGDSIAILVEYYPDLIEDCNIILNNLNDKYRYWACLNNRFQIKFNKIFKKITKHLKKLEIDVDKKSKIFKGKKFYLFAIDVNNLHISFSKKYQNLQRIKDTPIQIIKKKYLRKYQPYFAHFFVSENLKSQLYPISENEFTRIYIESMIKDYTTRKFLDVDVNLGIVISPILDFYKDQIKHFYLCSADKDFYLLIQKAQNYGIPVTLVISDEKTISEELEIMVNYQVDILY